MMSSECAIVIWLDEIIEVQKGLDWFKNHLENQYWTSTWDKKKRKERVNGEVSGQTNIETSTFQ